MNHLREEYCISLPTVCTPLDSFTALWENLARTHHFLKLTFPHTPTPAEVKHALSHQDGSLSPYSSRLFQDYEIVDEKQGTVLLTNRSPLHSIGTFYATQDRDAPHRYFVGFAFSVGRMKESITGMLLYMDEQGVHDADRTILCSRILVSYDVRNGRLRSGQTFLYHQTLLFVQPLLHPLLLHLAYLPYSSDIIQDHGSLCIHKELSPEALAQDSLLSNGRFLRLPLRDGTTLLLDLGSLSSREEEYSRQRFLFFDTYTLYEREKVEGFLEVAHVFPERGYSDGYPMNCIHCQGAVLSATYAYKLHPHTATTCGLGSGYCPACRIRYSYRRGKWVCARIRLDGSMCHGDLLETEGVECSSGHLHASDQTVVSLPDPPQRKYPYRRSLRFQWFPSDDALFCARTTRILEENDTSPLYALRIDGDGDGDGDGDDDLFKEESDVL